MLFIESLDIVRELQTDIIQFEIGKDDSILGKLDTHREKILVLKRNLQKEEIGQKYFNESRDLLISYQQYLHQVKNRKDETSTVNFRRLNRELTELQGEVYGEVKQVSLEKILWSAGGDFSLILLAIFGVIGLMVVLKDQIRILINNNKNLASKLESSLDYSSGGSWSMVFGSLNLDLSPDAVEILNLNIFEPKVGLSNFLDYFTEETARDLKDQIQLCTKLGDSFKVEVQKRDLEGERSWIQIKGTLILEEDVEKIVGTISDIDQVRQSEHRFTTLFDNMSQPAFISGENGLWDCNKATLKFFKLGNKEDFLDKKLPELFPLNQPDGRGSLNTLKSHMKRSQREEGLRYGWTFRTRIGEVAADVQLFPIVKNGTSLFLHVLKEGQKHISVLKDRQFRALICDPHNHGQQILKSYFQEEGWEVSITGNMAEALALKEDVFFDIIVLDFSLPDLNLELFTLNQNETHLVGMGGTGKETILNKSKVDSFISKPIMKEVVIGLIQKVSSNSEKLIVEDVLDLYSGRSDVLASYCDELEIYLEAFDEQFEKSLHFDEWDELKDLFSTLQSVSKKFSCRGLNQIFENSNKILKSRDHIRLKENHKKVMSSFRELIRDLRSKLGSLAA